jgi:hypothetical protein
MDYQSQAVQASMMLLLAKGWIIYLESVPDFMEGGVAGDVHKWSATSGYLEMS